jgi:hypothetical protein
MNPVRDFFAPSHSFGGDLYLPILIGMVLVFLIFSNIPARLWRWARKQTANAGAITGPASLWNRLTRWLGYGVPQESRKPDGNFKSIGPYHKTFAFLLGITGAVWTFWLLRHWEFRGVIYFILAVIPIWLAYQWFFYFAGSERKLGWPWVIAGLVALAWFSGSRFELNRPTAAKTLQSSFEASVPVLRTSEPDSAELERVCGRPIDVGASPAKTILTSQSMGVITIQPGQSVWIRAEGTVSLGENYLEDFNRYNYQARYHNVTSVDVTPDGGQVSTVWGFPRTRPDNYVLYGAPAAIPALQFGGSGNATWITSRWQRVTYRGNGETFMTVQLNLPRMGKLYGVIPEFWNRYKNWELNPTGFYTVHIVLEPEALATRSR